MMFKRVCTLRKHLHALRPYFSQESIGGWHISCCLHGLQNNQNAISPNHLSDNLGVVANNIAECLNCLTSQLILRRQRRALGLRFSKFTDKIFSVCFVNL